MDRGALGQFPDEELEAWQEFTGNTFTLNEYKTQLAYLAESAEEMGCRIQLVSASVAELAEELARRGLDNTTENRARVISELSTKEEGDL